MLPAHCRGFRFPVVGPNHSGDDSAGPAPRGVVDHLSFHHYKANAGDFSMG